MARYLVLPLIFILGLLGFLFWIGDQQRVVLEWVGKQKVDVTLQFAIVALVLAILGIIALWTLARWLWTLPNRVRGGVTSRRKEQALDAMQAAILAGATGNAELTRKRSEKVRALMRHKPNLGLIISAEAAHDAGDFGEAQKHYQALLAHEDTRLYARRGLSSLAVQAEDHSKAIDHAQTAFTDNPKAGWAFDTLFREQVGGSQWDAALSTLAEGEKRKHVSKDAAARYRAALMTAQADDLSEAGRASEAADLAASAVALSPQFAPATALAAKLYHAQGKVRRARNLILKSWALAPHPALGLAYSDLIEGEKDRTREKYMAALIDSNPSHPESGLLQATDALKTKAAVRAYKILTPLLNRDNPTARLCLMAADAERQMNNMKDARIWMERAALAPRDPDWSDLDPAGDAFNYTDEDWQRLTLSYGETGTLIHPRQEKRLRARPVLPGVFVGAAVGDAISADAEADRAAESAELEPPIDPELYANVEPAAPLTAKPQTAEAEANPDDNLPEVKAPSADNPDWDNLGDNAIDSSDLAERLDSLLGPKSD